MFCCAARNGFTELDKIMQNQSFLTIDPSLLKSEERILLAAIKIFADYPPELASIRMIAKEANVNYSAVAYHFKNKENLYQEVIRRVAGIIRGGLLLPETPPTDPEVAKMELRAFIGRLADWIFGSYHAVSFAKIIMREHLSPSPVYEQLNEDMFKRILTRMTDVVLCITQSTDRRRGMLQFFSIAGQVLGFRIERELLVRHLNFAGFSPIEIEELKSLLFQNIFRQLGVQP